VCDQAHGDRACRDGLANGHDLDRSLRHRRLLAPALGLRLAAAAAVPLAVRAKAPNPLCRRAHVRRPRGHGAARPDACGHAERHRCLRTRATVDVQEQADAVAPAQIDPGSDRAHQREQRRLRSAAALVLQPDGQRLVTWLPREPWRRLRLHGRALAVYWRAEAAHRTRSPAHGARRHRLHRRLQTSRQEAQAALERPRLRMRRGV